MNTSFFRQYIKDIRRVGAVTPSSRFLARKMVETIDFSKAKVIIEYGPGTGAFTAEITKRMNADTKLIALETNEAFYKVLQAKYKNTTNVEILNVSAEEVSKLHAERNLPRPDYIISGLPFAALPSQVSKAILAETVKLLAPKGEFITFQYTLLKKNLLSSYFKNIQVIREVRNIPPAYVLRCHN